MRKNPPCHHHFTFTSNLTRLPFALCKTVKERTKKKIVLETNHENQEKPTIPFLFLVSTDFNSNVPFAPQR